MKMSWVLSAAMLSVCFAARGAVYNVKILSDKVCDLTDLQSFCDSATSRWDTNDEKAAAVAHWFGVLGNQTGSPYDWMPVEPVLHFNNLMNAQCAFWTGLYDAVAEGGMGWIGRHYEVGDHTVPELEYDGTRHYVDNTYKFYATKCDGRTIISITEMDDVAGPCARGPQGRYHWLCYHTPMALCEDRDGYVPDANGHDSSLSRAWLPGSWLRREAAGRAYFADPLDDAWVQSHWKEFVTESFHSVYRYVLNLRDGEHYTRYWKQQGATSDYFYPTSGGDDPDSNHNERGNGLWVFEPDLGLDASFESLTNAARGTPAVHPASVGTEAVAVFKIQSANLTTGAIVEANVRRADAGDSVAIEASGNAGRSWFTVWEDAGTGNVHVNQNISDALKGTYAAGDLRTVLNYLVRVRMTADGAETDAGLDSIKITTITVCNRQLLPRLGLGRNYVTVDCDAGGQHETKTLRPLLKNDLYRRDAVDWANIATQGSQTSWSATLYTNSTTQEGYATFQLDAPRPIFRLRMGGSIWIGNWWEPASNYVRYEYRLWTGSSWGGWVQAGLWNGNTLDNYHKRRNQTKYVEKDVTTPDVTQVQFRFVFRAAGAGTNGAGANHLRMEVDYPAVHATFKPIEVTYNWTEYYEPLPPDADSGGVTRTHTETVTSLPHGYYVNTGGDIRPRTNWVRTNLEGSSPEPVTPGYSDGTDLGGRDEIPSERYVWGSLLSLGKSYTVSVDPAADSFRTAGDDQELTDGRVKEPQAQGPWPDACLANWPDGVGTLDVTVDLGSVTTVGGARVDAFYASGSNRFPNSVTVQTSTDGTTFTTSGTDRHKGARYALNNWPADWPLYRRFDSPDYGEFPNYGQLGNYIFVPFQAPVQARYVKFLVEQQPGRGFMLSEVHVWDSLLAERWTPRLAHEPPANSAPQLAPIGDKTVNEGETLAFTVSATDPDGDTLTYSAAGLPVGAAFDTSTQTFSWTADWRQAGTHTVTFSVSDGRGKADSEAITVTVNAVDEDADGLPDGWELTYFSTVGECVPDEDPDEDGLTNSQEYERGTHPLKSAASSSCGGKGIPSALAATALALFLRLPVRRRTGRRNAGNSR